MNFLKYTKSYIKADICTTYQECGYDKPQPWSLLRGGVFGVNVVYNKCRITFVTPDSILYSVWTCGGGGEAYNRVFVDINGAKLPNVLDKDVFWLERNQSDGGAEIIPSCSACSTNSINSDCSKTGNGYYCAEKIRRAGWKIDSTYPW